MTIPEKLDQLRAFMAQKNIDAWIIPGTDPHQSEYLPKYWNEREWISGFSGSAGQVVITKKSAGLWTDSRYFLQAEKELRNSGIKLYKLKVEGEQSINDFLLSELKTKDTVGINPLLFSVNAVGDLNVILKKGGILLNSKEDLIKDIWDKRPELSKQAILLLEEIFTGANAANKLQQIRNTFDDENGKLLLTSLDEIAWTFNIRGQDIDYNPLVVSWGLITKTEAKIYLDLNKVDDKKRLVLQDNGIALASYDELQNDVKNFSEVDTVYIDPNKVNQLIYQNIPTTCNIVFQDSPITLLKSVKNKTEVDGIKNAMIKDGVALVRFLMNLEKQLEQGDSITEFEVGTQLKHYRSQQEHFFGESFNTIAGYKENGAIVHYAPSETDSSKIKAEGTLLFDSGGQYFDGTTDITRTIALGAFSDEFAFDYTLVLKGVIALSQAVFPKGTCGIQLDILARKAMWKYAVDFGHGTGHGVGHFLNVHEGPQTIRKEGNTVPFQEGMTITIEPGIYRPKKYGIRTENMLTTVLGGESEFGSFLKFETLTLCPIDVRMIKQAMLNTNEKEWLNNYHKKVYAKLSPRLNAEESNWLKDKTRALEI